MLLQAFKSGLEHLVEKWVLSAVEDEERLLARQIPEIPASAHCRIDADTA